MKKLFTLILLVVGVVGTAKAEDTWTLHGDYSESDTWPSYSFTNGTCVIELTANTTYYFKVVNGSTWYGNNGDIYFYTNFSTKWEFKTSEGNCKLHTEFGGNYTFTINTTDSNPKISVTYPNKTTTIFLNNNLNWNKPYVYTLKTAYWNETNGSGASGRPAGIEMSRIGSTNIWKADVSLYGGFVAFVENISGNPENFYNTEAIYRGDYLLSGGSLFVPIASGSTETKNSTKYYKEGSWYSCIYTREGLTVGSFGTICLPFDATVEGATVYEISSKIMESETLKGINLVSVSTLTAGHAYIFKATSSTLTATISGNTYNASALADDSNGTNGGMVGNLSTDATNVTTGKYVISGNKLRKVNGGSATVAQYRAYITLTGISKANARSANFISFDDETSGIKNIQSENGQQVVYNLQGQRVLDGRKGLLIVDGKKVLR